jgi:hypothetical protein
MSTSFSNNPLVLNLDHKTKRYPSRIFEFKRIMNGFQQVLRLPSWNLGHSRTFRNLRATKTECVSSIGGVSFKAREFSNSVETKRGLRVGKNDNKGGGDDEEDLKEKNSKNVSVGKKNFDDEETEVEKEAWKLLQKALVTYCDTPVGTVAANDDSGNESPLNYDQVFIRDFIPSALAFLLKGEHEIVKNFLLHTLQLQVIILMHKYFLLHFLFCFSLVYLPFFVFVRLSCFNRCTFESYWNKFLFRLFCFNHCKF